MSQLEGVIGIDPGSSICGLTVLNGGHIAGAWCLEHSALYRKLAYFLCSGNYSIVVEDIRPYSLRLTPQVIDTCKFIGELLYRLRNEAGASVDLLHRNDVKKWAFDTFPHICNSRIKKKIEKKNQRIASGEFRTPTFVYVDDKIIVEALKYHYNIPMPPPGKGYMYGLKDHSWQALALATLYQSRRHQFVT